MKRGYIFLLLTIFLVSSIIAQDTKIDISPTKETFGSGENITIKVILLDGNNNPINVDVPIILEDAGRIKTLEKTIPSNELVEIDLGENSIFGYWTVSANYQGATGKGVFVVEVQELVSLELKGDSLIVKNVGNTKYERTIQIIIGETVSTRNPELEVGESIAYKLVAPQGNYNIQITDGKTTIRRDAVQLTGTGKAIGTIDESVDPSSSITGGIAPEGEDEFSLLTYTKKNKFIYAFVLAIFGAMILIAIERRALKK